MLFSLTGCSISISDLDNDFFFFFQHVFHFKGEKRVKFRFTSCLFCLLWRSSCISVMGAHDKVHVARPNQYSISVL